MSISFRLIVICIIFVWIDPSSANEGMYVLRDRIMLAGVVPIKKKLSSSSLMVLDFVIGQSILSDVTKSLKGKQMHNGEEAGRSFYFSCYKGNDGTIASFESHGEMGGPDHTITTALVLDSAKTKYSWANKCTTSSKIEKSITVSEIRLGMTKDEVRKKLGKPSKETKSIIIYAYLAVAKTPKGDGDISSNFEIRFKNKKVSEYSLSKIESY